MRLRPPLLWALFVLGCTHTIPAPAVDATASLVAQAEARPVPERLQARLSVKVDSPLLGLAGSTGGALILDRPGKGHLAVFGPLGGPLVTAQTEGTGLAVAVTQDHQHRVAASADRVLRDTTGGLLGLDDVLGLLEGQVPLDADHVRDQRRLADGDLEVDADGPKGTRTTVVLDAATATPVSMTALARDGRPLASATYAPFAVDADSGLLLPTEVTLTMPDLDLTLTLRYKSWSFPATVPDVFGLAPPEGWTSEPLELTGGIATALGLDASPR